MIPNHLQNPWMLLLALPIVAAVWVAWRRRLPSLRVASLQPFRAAGAGRPLAGPGPRWPLLLEGLALLCLTVALARPQHGVENRRRNAKGIDIMLLLDISGSMELYDTGKDYMAEAEVAARINEGVLLNRINTAKRELLAFIDERPDDQLGLVAFSGSAYLACPPTLDHDFLKGRVAQLDTRLFQTDGTNIAAALASGTQRLRDSKARRRVMVLFTDGKNSVDDAITPRVAANAAKEFDIAIHTVGIGSENAFAVQQSLFGRRLGRVPSEFDEPLLKEIAEKTGGRYYTAKDAEGLREVMQEIDALEKVEFEQVLWVDYRELFLGWTVAGLALLGLALLLEHTRYLKTP